MIKIRSVTDEIFLIWSNVARTNVAWTYVPLWHRLKMVPESFILSLVKIGSVTAEIFLIWTNVARTNIVLTNITVTVDICLIWSQEPTFKIRSKSGQ